MAMPVTPASSGRSSLFAAPQMAIARPMTEFARSTDRTQLMFVSRVNRERRDQTDDTDEPSDDRDRGEADRQEHCAGHKQRENGGLVPPVDASELRELPAKCGVGSKQLQLDFLDPTVELVSFHPTLLF